MQLRLSLVVCILVTLSFAFPRNFPDNNKIQDEKNTENFVLIGGSSNEKIKSKIQDDKNFRSGHYYSLVPMAIAHTKPNSDYYSLAPPQHNNHHHPANGLINANVQLLEPFMLVTFLLFVLSLLDKAKMMPISRIDTDFQLYEGYTNFINAKRNQTDF
ncbi:hypothetical protein ACKWTF_002897 [Chironomus riparius]